jgi:hypothetical protein
MNDAYGPIRNSAGAQVGYAKHGFAFDMNGAKRYSFDGMSLKDLETGQIVGRLRPIGILDVSTSPSADRLFGAPSTKSYPEPRFLVRRGVSPDMWIVWDRETHRPAKLQRGWAAALSEEQAQETLEQLKLAHGEE